MADPSDEGSKGIALLVITVILLAAFYYYATHESLPTANVTGGGISVGARAGASHAPVSATSAPCLSCQDAPPASHVDTQPVAPRPAAAKVPTGAAPGGGRVACGQSQPWTSIGLAPHCGQASPRDPWLTWL